MKIILMEENRYLELYPLELLQTTKCTLKGNCESQHNLTSHLSFNGMTFLENIHWHTPKQLSL